VPGYAKGFAVARKSKQQKKMKKIRNAGSQEQ